MPEAAFLFYLREAEASDANEIRSIIQQVRINPTGLDWRRFLVAVDSQGMIIGCGQVKIHRDGSHELASIAVLPERRNQGVARCLIQNLVARHQSARGQMPLYLMCRSRLGGFYEKFSFQPVEEKDLPPYFRRIQRLANTFRRITPRGEGLLVMSFVGNISRADQSEAP